jgi:amidophosphoribosyltransferase
MIRHPHIYGIDLASPSELIAHTRNEQEIAEHIGAEQVIFQTLDDLKKACAVESPRPNQEFEVGVFCGSYVTPVEPDYFEHLDRIRGNSKKAKVIENAREAVIAGVAGPKEFQIAVNGAKVTSNGDVVPVESSKTFQTNGNYQEDHDDSLLPRERMDIALHNFGDYRRN